MNLFFDQQLENNYDHLSSLEWLETNGLGGWSSGTLSGAHTRRYHGLLVASDDVPVKRKVIVSKVCEEIHVGDQFINLDTNNYHDTVHPRGYLLLQRFEKVLNPVFVYECDDVILEKSIIQLHETNTVIIRYKLLKGNNAELRIRPLLALRDIHHLGHAVDGNANTTHENGRFTKELYFKNLKKLSIDVPNGEFLKEGYNYDHFLYTKELERGMDCNDHLFCPGYFKTANLKENDELYVTFTCDEVPAKPKKAFSDELKRRQKILAPVKNEPQFIKDLVLASEQFIVKRGENLNSIIAGYHWFTDWGRDTMIALPGICLVTGKYSIAQKILMAFANVMQDGMIPNRFPEKEDEAEYNTVDATLWFVVAIYKYYQYTHDTKTINKLYPVIEEIIRQHFKGTRYNIQVDSDGLLYAGEEGIQLTWMDAKVADWVVTPRIGKPVEINALWFNTLSIAAELALVHKDELAHQFYTKSAKDVKKVFLNKFWNEERGYFNDLVAGDQYSDLRPNQVFALSLPFDLVDQDKAMRVLSKIDEELLTPLGLRSLSANCNDYTPRYSGDIWQRDGAYHQGTVWSWLIGPYISAKVKYGDESTKSECMNLLGAFEQHMNEAGLGSISEIFDADAPYYARGCISQAWSVAELLRVYFEDLKS